MKLQNLIKTILNEGYIDKHLELLKKDGFNEIIKLNDKIWLYNKKENTKYPITLKDYKKYKQKIHDVFGDFK